MVDLKGECLCGLVHFNYKGEVGEVINCHCSECRKWHAAAFRTRTVAAKENFTWLSGEDEVAYYDGLPNVIKTFCKVCGSNLISLYKDNDAFIGLPIAALEGAEKLKPVCHVFVDFKAPWHDITDDLPQHSRLPSGQTSIHKIGRVKR